MSVKPDDVLLTEVYVDLETTSLNPLRGQVWEAAYAVGDGPIYDGAVRHTLDGADARSLRMNGYHTRGHLRAVLPEAMTKFEAGMMEAVTGAMLIGANVEAFDSMFMFVRWGEQQLWHYRTLDIESYAAGVMGWRQPRSLRDTCAAVQQYTGILLPEPDHTARGDVEATRAVHRALLNIDLERNTP